MMSLVAAAFISIRHIRPLIFFSPLRFLSILLPPAESIIIAASPYATIDTPALWPLLITLICCRRRYYAEPPSCWVCLRLIDAAILILIRDCRCAAEPPDAYDLRFRARLLIRRRRIRCLLEPLPYAAAASHMTPDAFRRLRRASFLMPLTLRYLRHRRRRSACRRRY